MSDDNLGWSVAMRAVKRSVLHFEDSLVAAYVIGSLGHGGFSARGSDIDVGFVFDEVSDGPARAQVFASIRSALSSDLGGDADPIERLLLDRLSIFHCGVEELRRDEYAQNSRWPLLDRVDLLGAGVCVAGSDIRREVPIPAVDVVADAAVDSFIAMFPMAHFEESLRAAHAGNDVRKVCKLILGPIRMAYTVTFGRVVGNIAAASWFVSEHGVDGALEVCEWRCVGTIPDVSYESVETAASRLRDAALRHTVNTFPPASGRLAPLIRQDS